MPPSKKVIRIEDYCNQARNLLNDCQSSFNRKEWKTANTCGYALLQILIMKLPTHVDYKLPQNRNIRQWATTLSNKMYDMMLEIKREHEIQQQTLQLIDEFENDDSPPVYVNPHKGEAIQPIKEECRYISDASLSYLASLSIAEAGPMRSVGVPSSGEASAPPMSHMLAEPSLLPTPAQTPSLRVAALLPEPVPISSKPMPMPPMPLPPMPVLKPTSPPPTLTPTPMPIAIPMQMQMPVSVSVPIPLPLPLPVSDVDIKTVFDKLRVLEHAETPSSPPPPPRPLQIANRASKYVITLQIDYIYIYIYTFILLYLYLCQRLLHERRCDVSAQTHRTSSGLHSVRTRTCHVNSICLIIHAN